MRNFVSGAVNMIRVEVQSADFSIRDDKIVGSPRGNSGTNLVLLSDDDTGFMPYRIDNFSKEVSLICHYLHSRLCASKLYVAKIFMQINSDS